MSRAIGFLSGRQAPGFCLPRVLTPLARQHHRLSHDRAPLPDEERGPVVHLFVRAQAAERLANVPLQRTVNAARAAQTRVAMMRRMLFCATWAALDARLALMDGRGGTQKRCEPQYIPIGGGGGSGLSEAEIKLLVQNEVASLRDDLVGRMQNAASMATQPLEQALSETQAECRTLERLDEAIEMLKRAPGIEEVDQRLAFSDAKLSAALARLDAATLAAAKTASPPPETASPPPEGAAPSIDAKRLERLEQAVADLSREVAAATAAAKNAAANAAPAAPAAARPPPPPPVSGDAAAAALARAGELERAVVDVAEALEREARARMDADTSVEGRMRKLENATLGVAERHAKALETLITYTYPFQQRGVSMS